MAPDRKHQSSEDFRMIDIFEYPLRSTYTVLCGHGGVRVCTSSPKKIALEVAGQTLDFYCVCCELSASIADSLQFVNILVSGIFHGHFAQRLAVIKPCLQIVRRLLWKQTTTHNIRNNNPMFDQQSLTQFVRVTKYM